MNKDTEDKNFLEHMADWITLPRFFFAAGMTFFVTSVIFPFYWMITTSFKAPTEIIGRRPTYFPNSFSLQGYRELFDPSHPDFWNFGRSLFNSFRVAVPTAILAVAIALLGAYAIARLRFRGKDLFLHGVLLVYMFPTVMLMIPLFAMLSNIGNVLGFGIQDNLFILIVTYLAQTLPVALYMLTNYFKSIPSEIEQAGLVDGCSRLGVIWRITIPLSIPALVSVGIYTFMIAWNEFLYAFVFLNNSEAFTVPIMINAIQEDPSPRPHVIMAASTITSIPVMVLFLSLQKFLKRGLTAGSVKQ